jgi:hypothetical protein
VGANTRIWLLIRDLLVKARLGRMNHNLSTSIKLVLFAAGLVSISIAGAQNVVVNGDFETGPFETIGTVTGWVVTGNVGDVSGEGFTTASHAAGFSVGGDSQGNMLSQTLATTIGQSYALDFDAGVFGVRSGGPLMLQIQVLGAGMGTLINDTVTPPYNGNFNPAPFANYSYMFTADSTSTILKFTDVGLGNANADVMLDTVEVEETPEPASWALMIAGAVPLGLILRRRRVVRP